MNQQQPSEYPETPEPSGVTQVGAGWRTQVQKSLDLETWARADRVCVPQAAGKLPAGFDMDAGLEDAAPVAFAPPERALAAFGL